MLTSGPGRKAGKRRRTNFKRRLRGRLQCVWRILNDSKSLTGAVHGVFRLVDGQSLDLSLAAAGGGSASSCNVSASKSGSRWRLCGGHVCGYRPARRDWQGMSRASLSRPLQHLHLRVCTPLQTGKSPFWRHGLDQHRGDPERNRKRLLAEATKLTGVTLGGRRPLQRRKMDRVSLCSPFFRL